MAQGYVKRWQRFSKDSLEWLRDTLNQPNVPQRWAQARIHQVDLLGDASEQSGANEWHICEATFQLGMDLPSEQERAVEAAELERLWCVLRDVLNNPFKLQLISSEVIRSFYFWPTTDQPFIKADPAEIKTADGIMVGEEIFIYDVNSIGNE